MTTDELVTLEEVAKALQVSGETARKLCVTGKLPWVSVGTGESRHARRVLRPTLEAYMRNERRSATAEQVRDIRRTFAGSREVEERW